jgi:hypothetical protein
VKKVECEKRENLKKILQSASGGELGYEDSASSIENGRITGRARLVASARMDRWLYGCYGGNDNNTSSRKNRGHRKSLFFR